MSAEAPDLRAAWLATCEALAVRQDMTLCEQLLKAWNEPQRHYHSLQHLRECLATLARCRQLAREPELLALALWFHDAVYDPRAPDNEARSADWARAALPALGLAGEACGRVARLVLATRDHLASDADMGLLLDMDLAILAAPAERFAEYEGQIRAEFAFVPEPDFRAGRRLILQGFLARERLFVTEAMHAAWDARARANLRQACEALGEG
ncbi:N-methyl-D-aspartate receptor NMDAR2C subunit [Mitsuaria sp. WAJ17]|uniref:HD domain-containing protein n=1 Tax=Mitsuaria sp. WAJ17 TaxID=2761452 RepID=UPI0015FF7865|nr:N-methyl-D-aspartate receptor NMDAR2C subunit [Mitsuaria sp. WAJ17]MBB2483680.1 N-methyl-D-aspartate receptor NMDAR2C subunit [Mitsuaria sp. WAJ17]